MVDKVSPEVRSKTMSRIRSKGMAPEMFVRRLVYHMGIRYRLHRNDLPGKPDLVFSSRKKIIFVHGCFWHQHAKCKDGHVPKSNVKYWQHKLERNMQRDKRALKELEELGWEVLVAWECEIKFPELLSVKIEQFLSKSFAQPNAAPGGNSAAFPCKR
ncbi:MAG: DNA mismatch endonuclease Vsr [Deferribacteres bacterium]|nr:DNA mismatch endonuclease Vsr [candidate division KSB1 bacterium]MCB9512097.1 DNA mismatch endonuclease Vsr [Deferribacteres bacterium]